MELNRNQQIAVFALAGIALISFGFRGCDHTGGIREDVIQIEQPQESDGAADPNTENIPEPGSRNTAVSTVLVHVAGEVKNPDVYSMPPNSRVIDAIRKAGGPTTSADMDALNLAAPLKDGEKISVPPKGGVPITVSLPAPLFQSKPGITVQPAPVSLPQNGAPSGTSSTGGKLKNPGDGIVNINTADLAELQRLPGVGPSTAQKIIEFRVQIGRFSLPDQLMDVKGIGPKKYEKMKPFISL